MDVQNLESRNSSLQNQSKDLPVLPRASWRIVASVIAMVSLLLGELQQAHSDEKDSVNNAPLQQASLGFSATADPRGQFQFSSNIPHDLNVVFPGATGYDNFAQDVQQYFDFFSWQTFIALNWPADSQGQPVKTTITDPTYTKAQRVWECYKDPSVVFADKPVVRQMEQLLGPNAKRSVHMQSKTRHAMTSTSPEINSFLEEDNFPLIDTNLNFAVFEIKINPDEVSYITQHNLNTLAGQQQFAKDGTKISLPAGYYQNPATYTGGKVGAIEIKAAWRILDPAKGDDLDRYYHQPITIVVAAENSPTKKPMAVHATVGLVGMHIVRKVKRFPAMIWSTFEHVDNTPDSPATAQNPDNTVKYSFYDPAQAILGQPNVPPALKNGQKHYVWNSKPPYAAGYSVSTTAGIYGSQIVRTYPIYWGTESTNRLWQDQLKGTVWANYRLIGSQWPNTEVPGNIGIPNHLANTTLETYIQDTSSCINCHGFAATGPLDIGKRKPVKLKSDFSFLFNLSQYGSPGSSDR